MGDLFDESSLKLPNTSRKRDLFDIQIDPEALHPLFQQLRELSAFFTTRMMMNDAYSRFEDSDGNFEEQFQSIEGFNQRLWELYLNEAFLREGISVDREHVVPDFKLQKSGQTVFIEATISNTPQVYSTFSIPDPKVLSQTMTNEEVTRILHDHYAMRIHNALIAKVKHRTFKKHYWELDHVQGNPFIVAIEAFHEPSSLFFSPLDAGRYLYGSKPVLNEHGTVTEFTELSSHVVPEGDKERILNSGFFFNHPNTENISAVICSNLGSQQKFQRMGYLKGYGAEQIRIIRQIFRFAGHPGRKDIDFYEVGGERSYNETWAEGLTVFHNPNAKIPLPVDFFDGGTISQWKFEDGIPKPVGGYHLEISASQDYAFPRWMPNQLVDWWMRYNLKFTDVEPPEFGELEV